LDAVVGFGLLRKQSGEYQLTPESETFLVKSSPFYFGPMVQASKNLMSMFMEELPNSVRTGKPAVAVEQEESGAQFFANLVEGLFAMNYPTGRFLADRRLLGSPKDVLDVAVGSGAWSIPLAEVDPEVRVTGLDFKDVLPVTRKFFERRGVEKQLTEFPGNLREVDLGTDRYDLVILGHILHTEGPASARALLKKAHRALKPGGRVVIAEFIPNDERTGPPQPLIFTLTMLLNSTEGTTYTMPELRGMLAEAGFKEIRAIEAPAPSPLVVGEKK
jgi:ubiquinone/menaquinone biosynthesis C-methylase UbiE